MSKTMRYEKIGMFKHMFDRFRNYMGYLQFPLLVYTALVSTLNYVPALRGYLIEFMIVGGILFTVFGIFWVYVDYRYIFPRERTFMFKRTPHLEERFKEINGKLDTLVRKLK